MWTHDAFTLATSPIVHTLCGDFTYEATFQGAAINPTTSPVTYDTATRSFSVYSEDFDLIDAHPFTIHAFLTDHPTTATATPLAATLTIGDPCPDPNSVTAPA